MTKRGKRVEVTRSDAASSLEKAKQFLSEAAVAHTGGRHDAAMLCAIHAGISASDSVAIALAGVRSSDSDHSKAADLLDEVGGGARPMKVHASQLRQLLAKKTSVEYQSRRATEREAREAIKVAERITFWAESVVEAVQP